MLAKIQSTAEIVMARPKAYTKEFADTIIERMCAGESVLSICKDESLPARSTVMLWVARDEDGFSDRYAKAQAARAHYWADEILDIADDSRNDWMEREDPDNPGYLHNGESVQRARLRVDSRKWLLSKMLPQYADKQELNHRSSDGTMSPKSVDSDLVKALADKLVD